MLYDLSYFISFFSFNYSILDNSLISKFSAGRQGPEPGHSAILGGNKPRGSCGQCVKRHGHSDEAAESS